MSERRRFKVDMELLRSQSFPRHPMNDGGRELRERLSVVHLADPWSLARSPEHLREILRLIGGDIHVAIDEQGNSRWSLHDDVRSSTLASLWPDRILELIEEAPDRIQTRTQQIFERWVQREFSIEQLLRESVKLDEAHANEEWEAILRVARWLRGHPRWGWIAESVIAFLGRLQARQKWLILAGPHFFGRQRELGLIKAFLEQDGARALVVEASGGLGKSALLARACLGEGALLPEARYAFVSLDFDDPRLDIRIWGTILRSISEQLNDHFVGAQFQLFSLESGFQVREMFSTDLSRELGPDRIGEIDSRAFSLLLAMAQRFNELAGNGLERTKLVIVVDTFERALQQHRELAMLFFETLGTLLIETGGALLLAGRGPILREPGLRLADFIQNAGRIELEFLDPESSARMLEHLGVKPSLLAWKVVERVGRSPLTLRLVARLNEREPITEERLFSPDFQEAVDDTLVQGFLVRRILLHLPDPRLRSLAHPGFVLRFLDADVVFQVLGAQIDPPLRDAAEASELLARLAQFQDLIVADASRGLRVRPEVRSSVVRLIERDKSRDTRRVHELAFDYFRAKGDASSLVEAAYHCAALGRDAEASQLDGGRALLALLREPLDEWSAERKDQLTGLVKGGENALQAALEEDELIAWEQAANSRISDLVAQGRFDIAKGILDSRSERSRESPLRQWDERLAALDAAPAFDRQERARALVQLRDWLVHFLDSPRGINRLSKDIGVKYRGNLPATKDDILFSMIQDVDRQGRMQQLFDILLQYVAAGTTVLKRKREQELQAMRNVLVHLPR